MPRLFTDEILMFSKSSVDMMKVFFILCAMVTSLIRLTQMFFSAMSSIYVYNVYTYSIHMIYCTDYFWIPTLYHNYIPCFQHGMCF